MMKVILVCLLTIGVLFGGSGIAMADVVLAQAADRSVAVTTAVYTAQIDAKGNLAELSVKGAKAFTHQFGDPGKPLAEAPSINVIGQMVAVRSGTARVEWSFGEDTVHFFTEGYNFECTLDPSVKAIVAPGGGGGALGKYNGGCTALVLANDLTVASKSPMHAHGRRYIPAAYTSGGIKPGTQIQNELRLGAPANTAQLLGEVRIRPYDEKWSPMPVNQNVLGRSLSPMTPHIVTLVQRNVGKAPQALDYRVAMREKGEGGKEVMNAILAAVLAGEGTDEQIVPLPALPVGAYTLTASAWQGGVKVKEARLEFTVGAAAPAPAAPAIPAQIAPGLWADRRPVARLFISQNQFRTAANPDGYLNKDVNVTTDDGKAAFRTNLLAYADRCIGIMKEMDAQGVIVWDLEGYSAPGCVYLGDPRLLPAYAPAMDAVADEFFRKFRDAGLKTGLTIRPIRVFPITGAESIAKWGKWGYVLYDDQKDDVVKEISGRIAYAKRRWGCTLFYMDSNGYESWENGKKKGVTIPAAMLQQLREQHPEVLILPEHPTPGGLEWAGQYAELRLGSKGTSAAERQKYPGAMSVLAVGGPTEESVFANWDAVADSVARGDALFFDGWYPSVGNRMVKELYRQAAWLRTPANIPDGASVADLLARTKRDDPAVRFHAVRALAPKADAAAGSALVALLATEKDWLVRKEVITALGALQTPEAVAALTAELKQGAFGHAYYAREQVRQLGAAALPVAVELAGSAQRQNRIDAAGLLRTILTRPALDALRTLTLDNDSYVKNAAAGNLNARLGM
jgi:hypothetical protein